MREVVEVLTTPEDPGRPEQQWQEVFQAGERVGRSRLFNVGPGQFHLVAGGQREQ
jgi:hypothetical protein